MASQSKKKFLYWAYIYTHSTQNKLVVLESCSDELVGEPLYTIYQKMISEEQYRDFEFVWVRQNPSQLSEGLEDARTTVVKRESREYYRVYSSAKYWINDNSVPDYIRPRKDQVLIGREDIVDLVEQECDKGVAGQRLEKRILAETPEASGSVTRAFKWVVLKVIRQLIKVCKLIKKYCRKAMRAASFGAQFILHEGRKRGICFSKNTKKLYEYMDKHKGERCFIMGNGPSLKAEDLDTLVHEYSFGSNMVYKIFDQTAWRPTYHCTIDMICARALAAEYKEHISSPLFTNRSVYKVLKEKPNDITYVKNYRKVPYRPSKRFLSFYYPSEATVTSFIIELAIFMGFKEIYLLGVDCTNVFGSNGHFTSNYLPQRLIDKDIARINKRLDEDQQSVDAAAQYSIDKSIYAYSRLEEFSRKCGVKIYNATRGGNLEVYERVDFDMIEKKGISI